MVGLKLRAMSSNTGSSCPLELSSKLFWALAVFAIATRAAC